jgi:hypothetical protein
MIQTRVSVEAADKFIVGMISNGYIPHSVGDHVHFTRDGITSIHYAVSYFEDEHGAYAFLGVRP